MINKYSVVDIPKIWNVMGSSSLEYSNVSKLIIESVKYSEEHLLNNMKANEKMKISINELSFIKKNKFTNEFIKEEELLEKLVISKLKCYYCKQNVLILYDFRRILYDFRRGQWRMQHTVPLQGSWICMKTADRLTVSDSL